ncbi:MAG TPA: ATP-dependent Clp protease ATP-binding subunit [Patescibacteria group bacterium]|nr:ATP-dependent Clp protease ATP-binding subunit [Patescibacteria group bacterium]
MIGPDLLQRFTTHLKEALQKALAFTVHNGRELVEPGDLVAGLMQEKGCIAAEILLKSHLSYARVEEAFRGKAAPHTPGTPITPDLSPTVKRLLEKCVLTAHLYEHKYVGTEHLLFALLETPLSDVHAFFEQAGISIDLTKQEVIAVLKSTAKFPDLSLRSAQQEDEQDASEELGTPPADPLRAPQNAKRPKALEVFARDLTSPESIAKLDPVIGREQETDRVIEILCRRVKNNPILLGDPGVGKTAIVEGLAERLAAGTVPDLLQGKRILAIDLALLVAGTMYRGEFEARLKQLVDEARGDQNIILFIDEIHTIVGAGSTSGSLDAANILKPALARGEIHCIGATTWTEYKKYIEPDAALERRYQVVDIPEPSAELTLQMLQGLKKRYEEHHGVTFEFTALQAAVQFGERYVTDRFFPDKAIDLLDEAAAYVNARRKSQESMERLRSLDIALSAAQETKEAAVASKSLTEAALALQNEERLTREKKNLERTIKISRAAEHLIVTREHIAEVVARLSHVPSSTILSAEHDQLAHLEKSLSRMIVGQDQAIRAVSETVRHTRLGLTDPRRPKASFLFVGPSGVGKTEMARALAREIFGKEDALVKLDMSEFSEGHSISKLLGSPAGYVGYREGNRLTDTLRKHPHAVLLFDEFEKAHPDVQHILLQALEDGQITEATGRPVSFRHAYIVLTSNVGADFLNRTRIGFSDAEDASAYEALTREQLADRFRPELLNRLDRIVVFQPLSRKTLKEIVRRELELVLSRLEQAQKIAYTVSDDVLEWLLSREFRTEEGARGARRLVEREVTALIGKIIAENPNKRKGKLKITKDKLVVS